MKPYSFLRQHCFNILIVLIIAVQIFSYFKIISHKVYDHDELEHVHVAWCIKNGQVMYRDFTEIHGPLFPLINAFIWKTLHLPENFSTIQVLRGISFLYATIIVFFTFFLFKQLFPKYNYWGISIIVMLGFSPFLLRATEFRPDNFQNMFLLGGLYILIKNISKVRNIHACFVGILWGLALATNFKAGIAVLIMLFFSRLVLKIEIKQMAIILGSALFPLLTLLIYFSVQGALQSYVINQAVTPFLYMFLRTLSGKPLHFLFVLLKDFLIQNFGYLFMYGYGCVTLYKERNPLRVFLVEVSLVLLLGNFLFCGWLFQSYLTVLPFLAIIGAVGLERLFVVLRARKSVLYYSIFFGMLILQSWITIDITYKTIYCNTNQKQVSLAQTVTQPIKSNVIFFYVWGNPNPAYVFHPHLLYYWHFPSQVFNIRIPLYAYDPLDEELVQKLQENMRKGNQVILQVHRREIDKLPLLSREYILRAYYEKHPGFWFPKADRSPLISDTR